MAIHWREASGEATLVNALKMAKIKSNFHTGQYTDSVPPDHNILAAYPLITARDKSGGTTVTPGGHLTRQLVCLQGT